MPWGTNFISLVVFLAVQLHLGEPFRTRVHPACSLNDISDPVFNFIEDVTSLLHGKDVPIGTCVFNPTITRLRGDLYLWAARAYTARNSRNACSGDYRKPLPSLTKDGWTGKNHVVLAVTRTQLRQDGRLVHEIVGHAQVDVPLEDPRLFKDAEGLPWLLMHYPKAGSITVSLVNVTCNEQTATRCTVRVTGSQVLWYTKMMKVEKNWVPHNGTTRMSYPRHPSFTPHSVFDWKSYTQPVVHTKFDSEAPDEPFFSGIQKTFRGLVHFAGSTPAVLHDDGKSYVAVGHMRAHARCFHDVRSGTTSGTCAQLAARGRSHDLLFFSYKHEDGRAHEHHYKEYAMFLYRFEATPPYTITHVSHSFIPCTVHHSGIVFPAGLERIGPNGDFLITFGEANRYSRVLTMSANTVYKLLIPVAQLRSTVASYPLCSMPCTKLL